ncbi:hypothetical protein KGF56_001879 [Candida oxycetoniae]|uniref:Ubiquitin carboxyl-terminal hydrolase n=1 Tax=Candida oxycetoniae TaxID=497107 RepID=A0AAI9SY57_9ASCO|nr:uncharacterized protein KGF56_001879 [Candida oxycetoniae]KAI3405308.2 hypothetical protein KGF56_001879 [Candida oxycetoniae]
MSSVSSTLQVNSISSQSHPDGEISNGSLGSGQNRTVFSESQHIPIVLDNLGSLPSCAHLDQVLSSRAQETVLDTYRQAVLISHQIDISTTNYRTKDGANIDPEKILAKKLLSLKCSECDSSDFQQVMICLQCPNVSCHRHAHSHYKGSQHMFSIDSNLGLLYCFKCNAYINHPRLEKLRCQVMGVQSVEDVTKTEAENYSDPNKLAMLGLKGFVNLGSTCYMSSILQTFVHNPILKTRFFNNDLHYFNCKYLYDQEVTGSIHEGNACITCSIDKIFKEFYTMESTEGFGMTDLLTTAWYKQKSLAGFQEQDAHEFWQFLLNELHSDHIRVSNQHGVCTCISHACFGFQLQSCVKCNCGAENITVDPPTFELSLELSFKNDKSDKNDKHTSIDLYTCLDSFTREEKLDTRISCKSCFKEAGATKTLRLKNLPPVLSIQLKRFKHNIQNDTSSKVEIAVEIPSFFDLNKYTVDAEDGQKIFELFSVVCHIGSVSTGHYMVYTKNWQGLWFKFDDSIITIEKEEDAMEAAKSNGYLLYYIMHNT